MMISADYMSVDRDKPQQIEFVREVGPRMSEDAEIFHSIRRFSEDSFRQLQYGQIRALNSKFMSLGNELDTLREFEDGWDGYAAPAPSEYSLTVARTILGRLQESLVVPMRISACGDGGVAFSFSASGDRRAQIEVLNNGEKFAHLYDLSGNSYTYDWPQDIEQEPFGKLIEPIQNYIQR